MISEDNNNNSSSSSSSVSSPPSNNNSNNSENNNNNSNNNENVVNLNDVNLNVINNNDKRDEDFDDVESDEESFGERCELEGFKPCSQCHLWKLMMSFYDRKGPESWSQGIVPHFITCNSFIGRSYAKVLHGFIKDCMKPTSTMPLDINEPLYIIELGAGSGKFSFFMLKALDELKDICDFPMNKIVYIMTDFTENNFNFWSDHPSLKKYFENGTLDAGIFDAVNDSTITLRSGKVLGPGSSKNPICVVANYLFDTLYHDIFQVDGGVLKEGLVSTGSKRKEEPDPLNPDIIKRLSNLYQYNPIDANTYYNNEDGDELHLGRILKWYQECFADNSSGASIVFPIGALRALRRLSTFSNNRMIVISGDKGNNNPEQFVGLMDPHIAVHGSFSLMVNYHAIGMWFTSRGGFALHNPQEEASLKVGCFVLNGASDNIILNDTEWLHALNFKSSTNEIPPPPLSDILPGPPSPTKGLGPSLTVQTQSKGYRGSPTTISTDLVNNLADKDNERSKSYPYLRLAFNDAVDTFGPNDFFVLQKSLKEDAPNPPLKSIVSLLKLGDWDPDVFFKFRDAILNQIPNCGQKLRNDLCRGIPRVWENYYMLDLDKDIAFEIGRFFYGIRDYTNALNFYIESTNTVGEHHVTYHNQGLCYYSRGELEIALVHFEKSLSMNKDYEKARSWVEKVRKEIYSKNNNNNDNNQLPSINNNNNNNGNENDNNGNGNEGSLSTVSTVDMSDPTSNNLDITNELAQSGVSNLSISSS